MTGAVVPESGWARPDPEPPAPKRRHRCGYGGTPRCDVWLDHRGQCDRHRAATLAAAIKARVDTRGPIIDAWRAQIAKLDPDAAALLDRADSDDGPDRLSAYRDSIAHDAAARREGFARMITAHVREDAPLTRRALGDVLGIPAASGAMTDAIKLAVERGGLYFAKGVGMALNGLWPSREAYEAAAASPTVPAA